MTHKVLIANRGEIALRIIRACRELGLKSVGVYSWDDRDSLHSKLADESLCIGPSQKSYLSLGNLMAAVEASGSTSVHPGYGFLSENFCLARICEKSGISFIGPRSEVMEQLGNKLFAKKIAQKLGIPVMPGGDAILSSQEALNESRKIGFPLMIKAVFGGGGRGIRLITKEEDFSAQWSMAQKEAERAFGDGRCYLERFREGPVRHVEVQIIGDHSGRILAIGERDGSLQRRHQKILEEAPCSILTPQERHTVSEYAIKLAHEVGYTSLGTVEFLYGHGGFTFLEVNPRLQVEHTVTEEVTGWDLVKYQISLSQGENLPPSPPAHRGHALECRILGEHAFSGRASPGQVQGIHWPGGPGVRIDSALYAGYTVSSLYDPLIGKIITRGETRWEASQRMLRSLKETKIVGIETNIPLHLKILEDSRWQSDNISTGILNEILN